MLAGSFTMRINLQIPIIVEWFTHAHQYDVAQVSSFTLGSIHRNDLGRFLPLKISF